MTPEQLTALQKIYDCLADDVDGDEHMVPHIEVLHDMITEELNKTMGQPLEELDPTE